MIKDNINKPSSSEKNQTSESIPESSPAFLFCQKKSEINAQNENGWTPIYRSIISNDLGALKDLLNFGGDPNIANNIGETPLYLCVDTDNIEALKILLSNNPKPNCNLQKRNGETALHLSFKKNKINFAQILLENNADPNLLNKLYSQTATHLALINKINDENILPKLKENNADIYSIKDKYSKAAFDYAQEKGDENYVKLIKKIFGEKKQIHSLINNVSEDIKISINKSSNINKTSIDHLDNINTQKNSFSSQNTDKKHNENNIGVNKLNNNNIIYDKKKIKDIVVTTINKTVVSDISSNNKFSTPKEILTDLNSNTNSNMYTLENGISSFLSNNSKINNINNIINSSQFKKDIINESNPLDMMNQVIMSNRSNLYSTISQNKVSNNKSTEDKKEGGLNDSLELEKEKETINEDNDGSNNNNKNNKKEEVAEFKNSNNKIEKERHISYHNLNKNKDKDKIIPKLNLFNLKNSSKINNNNNNNNIKNNNSNNNNEANHSSIKNIKRKSYTSLCSNLHYETSTNPNTSMGSYFPNVLSNNIVSSIKNPENFNDNNHNHTKRNTSNYDDLTEENKYETLDNSKANNCLRYSKQNKTASNTSYKKNKKNVLTDADIEPDVVEKQIEQNEENNAPMPNYYSLSRLRDWLISCDLISYYNLLKNNTSCNIEQFIQSMQENKNSIKYRDIENLGIKKPGHIFRFLIKLQMDANIIDYNVHNKIINKFNNNVLTTIGLTASNNEIKCCGMTLTLNDKDNNTLNNTNYYSDIFRFLKALNLSKFKENFIHNGFDQVDYIILQLFSEYKFDKVILNDFLHVYNNQDKKFVINTLYEEKYKIANELGIYYDENEKKEILKTFEKNDYNNEGCNIF